MTARIFLIVLAGLFLVSACAEQSSGLPQGGSAPPPPGDAPFGVNPDEIFALPGQNSEFKALEGVSQEKQQADAESCFAFANAQVANDTRIDRDIDSARGGFADVDSRLTNYNRSVDSYYYQNQREALFRRCMRAKGYGVE